jgi:Ser/Thr protein kinase RdoA (MazF antagonist)
VTGLLLDKVDGHNFMVLHRHFLHEGKTTLAKGTVTFSAMARRRIRRSPQMQALVIGLGKRLVKVVEYFHRWGIVHADLTPNNVLCVARWSYPPFVHKNS